MPGASSIVTAERSWREPTPAGPALASPFRVLVVEDHPDTGARLQEGLARHGFYVEWVTSLDAALGRLGREPSVHIVVLDLALPDADGLEAVRVLRAEEAWDDLPILVLTVYRDLELRVRALEEGADDFLIKPFAMEELAARLRALGRRGRVERRRPRAFGPLTLDPRDRSARLGDRRVLLTAGEFALLWRMALRAGGPASSADLGAPDPGDPIALSESAVRVIIHRLRRKLARAFGNRVRIRTLRPRGYLLEVRG